MGTTPPEVSLSNTQRALRMGASLCLVSGVFIIASAAMLNDSVRINALYGTLISVFGVWLLLFVQFRPSTAPWLRWGIAGTVIVVGLALFAGTAFRVLVENLPVFG